MIQKVADSFESVHVSFEVHLDVVAWIWDGFTLGCMDVGVADISTTMPDA